MSVLVSPSYVRQPVNQELIKFISRKLDVSVSLSSSRLCIGSEMDASNSGISFAPDIPLDSPGNKTGSIGMLSLEIKDNQIIVSQLGIEPSFRRQGYANKILRALKEYADFMNFTLRLKKIINQQIFDIVEKIFDKETIRYENSSRKGKNCDLIYTPKGKTS